MQIFIIYHLFFVNFNMPVKYNIMLLGSLRMYYFIIYCTILLTKDYKMLNGVE